MIQEVNHGFFFDERLGLRVVLCGLLTEKGFTKAEVTFGSGDHGVDIIAEQNGIRFGIQCKLYQGQIPNKAVQEAYTGASYYDCDVAVIMSNSELTRQAKDEAQKLRVKFWRISDYVPQDDRTSSRPKANSTEQAELNAIELHEVSVKNYDEYVQRITEYIVSVSTISEAKSPDSCKMKIFGDAIKWLNIQNQSWYTLTYSMNVYLDITSKANHSEQVDFEFLCKKLNCFYCLANALSITGSQLQRNIQTKCKEFEKIIAHENSPISNEYLASNSNFWEINYLVQQEQLIFETLAMVIKSISAAEYDIIQPVLEKIKAHIFHMHKILIRSQR